MRQIQLIEITPKELQTIIAEGIEKKLEELKQHLQKKDPVTYLTRKQVSEMFQIDISSVHNWTKKGTLQAYQIGGRVYYKLSEIENAIVVLNKVI